MNKFFTEIIRVDRLNRKTLLETSFTSNIPLQALCAAEAYTADLKAGFTPWQRLGDTMTRVTGEIVEKGKSFFYQQSLKVLPPTPSEEDVPRGMVADTINEDAGGAVTQENWVLETIVEEIEEFDTTIHDPAADFLECGS